jgi:hypothetical protein
MKRLLLVILLLLPISAPAQFNGCSAGFCAPVVASGGFTPSCSQSSTFLAAATGVTLTADKQNYDTLICGLVSDGVWNFDVLYIWAAPTQATALINLANPGTFNGTTHGTVSFAAYQGFTGDGSTFYIDSGFNPATATTPKFVQNDAVLGVYVLTNRTTGSNLWQIGCTVGACPGLLFDSYSGGSAGGTLNSASIISTGSTTAQGAWNLARSDAVAEGIFLNSTEARVGGLSDTSVAPTSANIIFFGFNTGFGLVSDQMAAGWIGSGLNVVATVSVNSCKVNNRINTYLRFLQGQATDQHVYTNSAC